MKRLLFPLMLCVACFASDVPGVFAKQKSKKPALMFIHATLFTPRVSTSTLRSDSRLEIVVDEVSTDEGMKELAQAYATGGERALNKAMDKLHKGYCDLGPYRMVAKVVQSKADGVNRRIDILAKFPDFSPVLDVFAEPPQYTYVYIRLELDEHGTGKGSLTPKMRVTFNSQGQMTLGTRASQPFELTMAQEIK